MCFGDSSMQINALPLFFHVVYANSEGAELKPANN